MSACVAPGARVVDQVLAIHVIDDILNALELWQSVGETDARWVHDVWSLRITPRIAMDLPASAATAGADGAGVHAALLEWQMALAGSLP